jgi:hypothetical protein
MRSPVAGGGTRLGKSGLTGIGASGARSGPESEHPCLPRSPDRRHPEPGNYAGSGIAPWIASEARSTESSKVIAERGGAHSFSFLNSFFLLLYPPYQHYSLQISLQTSPRRFSGHPLHRNH